MGRKPIMVRSWWLPAENGELGGDGVDHLLDGYPAFGVLWPPAVGDAEFFSFEVVADDHADMAAAAAEFEGFDVEVGFFGFEPGAESVVVVGDGLEAGGAPEAPHDGEAAVDLFGYLFEIDFAVEVNEVASVGGEEGLHGLFDEAGVCAASWIGVGGDGDEIHVGGDFEVA